MKVVFVGPTLADAAEIAGETLVIRPPAMQGDIYRAVREGASAIGLIDGNFEHVAPVWHKEILFALSQGVLVLGAASMGALRAAECAAFGMVGIGAIYRQYMAGDTADDSDVALLHAPKELGYAPLTIPLVNVRATLRQLVQRREMTIEHATEVEAVAAGLFYKGRTWPAIVARVGLSQGASRQTLAATLRAGYVDQKRTDALELLEALAGARASDGLSRQDWVFHATSLWRRLQNEIAREAAPLPDE